MTDTPDFPRIISVDDHVVEPPDLWTSRVSSKYADRMPRVERSKAKVVWEGDTRTLARGDEGEWCDWWLYEDVELPLMTAAAAVGFETPDMTPTTYDELHLGAWRQKERLADMTADHIEGSVCYPNVVPRFCGQTFQEAEDKDLALECVRAYNDWMLDDWCGGDGRGRLIPLTLIPLWDLDLAIAEVRRCAEKGTAAVAFSENPYRLGLPSIHSGEWDPMFRECAEADVTLCMHIGSSSHMPKTSPDAPHIISSTTHFSVSAGALLDFLFSGTLDRIPGLRLFFAESQAGWMPFVLEQADWLWARREGSSMGAPLPAAPSSYLEGRVFTSIFNDGVALRNRDRIGIDMLCFETDYPHSVTTFPNTKQIAQELCSAHGLTDAEQHRLMRGTAVEAFRLERYGIVA